MTTEFIEIRRGMVIRLADVIKFDIANDPEKDEEEQMGRALVKQPDGTELWEEMDITYDDLMESLRSDVISVCL